MENQVLVFRIKNSYYAFPVNYVISIEQYTPLTKVPNMLRFLKGITTIREQVIPILDFSQLLFGTDATINNETKIIVLKTENLLFGAIVEETEEVITIPKNKISQVDFTTIGEHSQNEQIGTEIAHIEDRIISFINLQQLLATVTGIELIEQAVKNESVNN